MNPEYDELLVLAETLGEVKTKTEKLEAEFSTQARPLEAATNALSAALSGIKALQFHVLDNNLGQLSARVEEMRKAVDEQVGVIALELKKADETNAEKAGQEAEALRSEIAALQAQLGTLGAQFSAQLERVEFSAKEEAKKLQLIPGPAGAAGASLNPRGTFVDGETYNRLDVVSWLGSSYIAGVDGVTEKPSKNSNQWQVLASRGSGGSGGAGDFGSLAGVAQINQGGTGQTTRAAGLNALLPSQTGNVQYMLLTDGAGTVSWGAQPVAGLPSQTSNGGKLLTTDGTNASWSNAVTVSGSNATVTGTLTVNGSSSFAGLIQLNNNVAQYWLDSGATQRRTALVSSGNSTYFGPVDAGWGSTGYFSAGTTMVLRTNGASGTFNEAVSISTGGLVTIPSTSASTTTSTGALVVGNGTSGGLGVGGAINAGNNIVSTIASAPNGSEFTGLQTKIGADGSLGPCLVHVGALPSATAGSRYGYVTCYDTGDWRKLYLGGSPGVGPSGGQVLIPATLSSTSTSSGALVVSGGVGVAKGMVVGDQLRVTNASIPDLWLQNTSGATSAYRNILLRQNSDDTFKFLSTSDAGVLSKDNILTGSNANGAIGIGVAPAAGASSLTVAGVIKTNGTTASTSTSSGALVVSGGVGVAKSLNVGEAVTVAGGSFAAASFYKSASLGTVLSGATGSSYDLYLTNPAGNYVLQVPTGTRNAEFAATLTTVGAITSGASISTSAPVGGAGAWELGTYTTTAPSATGYVTIEIGGTVYKLLASNV